MCTLTNPNKVRIDFFMDWENAAKMRTLIKGKTMPAIAFKGRNRRVDTQPMTVGYFIEQLVIGKLKSVKPDAESIKWMVAGRERALKRRASQDEMVRNGANRKPPSERRKPGRIAGKYYPKYEAAMKRVAEKKRAAAEKRRSENKINSQPK